MATIEASANSSRCCLTQVIIAPFSALSKLGGKVALLITLNKIVTLITFVALGAIAAAAIILATYFLWLIALLAVTLAILYFAGAITTSKKTETQSTQVTPPATPTLTSSPLPGQPVGMANGNNNCWGIALLQILFNVPELRRLVELMEDEKVNEILVAYDQHKQAVKTLPVEHAKRFRTRINELSKNDQFTGSRFADSADALACLLQGVNSSLVHYTQERILNVGEPVNDQDLTRNELDLLEKIRGRLADSSNRDLELQGRTQLPENRQVVQKVPGHDWFFKLVPPNKQEGETLEQRFAEWQSPLPPEKGIYVTVSDQGEYRANFFNHSSQKVGVKELPKDGLFLQAGRRIRDESNDSLIVNKNPLLFPDDLTLKVPSGEEMGEYELVAMTNNHRQAHYTAQVKVGDQWFHCDDSTITAVTQAAAKKAAETTGELLYFRRKVPVLALTGGPSDGETVPASSDEEASSEKSHRSPASSRSSEGVIPGDEEGAIEPLFADIEKSKRK